MSNPIKPKKKGKQKNCYKCQNKGASLYQDRIVNVVEFRTDRKNIHIDCDIRFATVLMHYDYSSQQNNKIFTFIPEKLTTIGQFKLTS